MTNFYDWNKTISYDADVTIVISRRGKGKTYGIRKQCINDYIESGYRFVQIVRYKSAISDIAADYFGKVCREKKFQKYEFKTVGNKAYIAKKRNDDKPLKWELIGYFVALSQMQRSKESTYVNVKRLIFDEAIITYRDQFHQYLRNEFSLLTNVLDSCSRENPDDPESIPPRLYCLANACDLINPLFQRYGITEPPKFGYSWHDRKTCLVHYVDASEESDAKLNDTVAGRMARGTREADVIANNEFLNANDDFIEPKPSRAVYRYAIKYYDDYFCVWHDRKEALYYINRKLPKGEKDSESARIYTLVSSDRRINYIQLKTNDRLLKNLLELYYLGCLRFDTIATRENFVKMAAMFGVR